MSLKEKISGELKEAMKAKQADKLSVLRLLTTAIKNEEIAQKKELDDNGVLAVIKREAKQRTDAIGEYQKGGRDDLAQKEEAEKKMLEAYLPEQMSDEELEKIVGATKDEVGASSPADFGKLMGAVMAKTKGQADGQKVNALVKKALN